MTPLDPRSAGSSLAATSATTSLGCANASSAGSNASGAKPSSASDLGEKRALGGQIERVSRVEPRPLRRERRRDRAERVEALDDAVRGEHLGDLGDRVRARARARLVGVRGDDEELTGRAAERRVDLVVDAGGGEHARVERDDAVIDRRRAERERQRDRERGGASATSARGRVAVSAATNGSRSSRGGGPRSSHAPTSGTTRRIATAVSTSPAAQSTPSWRMPSMSVSARHANAPPAATAAPSVGFQVSLRAIAAAALGG